MEQYKIPIGEWVEAFIDFTTTNFSFITKAVSGVVETMILGLTDLLTMVHPLVFIFVVTLIAFFIAKRNIAIFTGIGLLLVWNLGLWDPAVSTITLVIVSTLLTVLIGLPLGILAAFYKKFYNLIMPILDFMQTMPAFVYLIPAIPFFGLGVVSAMITTVVFSMPPTIRLTALGIKQVPHDLIEAADSFGASRMQKLYKIQLPVAQPTIMAGINQTIMLSLSMVVIASMIGAGGLGGEVWRAIQRLRPGMGFEAGLAVVIIAIILDRLTQRFAKKQ